MTKRLRWIVLGLLLAGSAMAYFVYDPREAAEMPENVRNGIVEALELKYVREVKRLEQDADTLQMLVEHWGERYADQVRLTQRWKAMAQKQPATVTVKGDTVYSPPEIVEVVGDCLVGDAYMTGTCDGELWDVGGKSAARIYWTGLATFQLQGKHIEIDSGEPRLAKVLEFTLETPREPPARRLEARIGLNTSPGASVGISWYRPGKRLGWWGQVDYTVNPDSLVNYDNYSYTEDRWRGAAGVAWRLGG